MKSESCANCGSKIGRTETPHVWDDKIVCAPCRRELSTLRVGHNKPLVLAVLIGAILGAGVAVPLTIHNMRSAQRSANASRANVFPVEPVTRVRRNEIPAASADASSKPPMFGNPHDRRAEADASIKADVDHQAAIVLATAQRKAAETVAEQKRPETSSAVSGAAWLINGDGSSNIQRGLHVEFYPAAISTEVVLKQFEVVAKFIKGNPIVDQKLQDQVRQFHQELLASRSEVVAMNSDTVPFKTSVNVIVASRKLSRLIIGSEDIPSQYRDEKGIQILITLVADTAAPLAKCRLFNAVAGIDGKFKALVDRPSVLYAIAGTESGVIHRLQSMVLENLSLKARLDRDRKTEIDLHFMAQMAQNNVDSTFFAEWCLEIPSSGELSEIDLFNDNATDGTVLRK
jgi:hypothetical protein